MSESRKLQILFVAILLLGAALRLYHLGTPGIWIDEGFSILYTENFANLLPGSERGSDSPLFLFLLYFWRTIDTSLFFLRLLPAAFGVGTIYAAYLLARGLAGAPAEPR